MKQDDSTLPQESQQEVVKYADLLLRKAEAHGRFPTPVADLVSAAKLEVSRESVLATIGLDGFYRKLPNSLKLVPDKFKRAADKVIGLLHRPERMIHLDPTLHPKRRIYVTVHEIGHEFLPHQRSTFAVLEDSDTELHPEVQELYEREANVFASEVLFQGQRFATEAADFALSIKVPIDLAKKYGPSVYSAARRYVSTHREPCVLVVFDQPKTLVGIGEVIPLRRVIPSKSFTKQFGRFEPAETCGADNFFYKNRPKNKFTARMACNIIDVNGDRQPCFVEAFDSTHQILFILFPQTAMRQAG